MDKTLLGRWGRTDELSNTIKVYWANVDHCGTCSSEPSKPHPEKPNQSPQPSTPVEIKQDSTTNLNK